jgi:hypothetical protein
VYVTGLSAGGTTGTYYLGSLCSSYYLARDFGLG